MAKNWLSNLFKPKVKEKKTFNNTITMKGIETTFTSFGNDILSSDIILSSLRMKQRFFGKLEPRHVRRKDGKYEVITDSSISKVLRNPNEYQTTYDFLTQAYFMRKKDKVCYIYHDFYLNNNKQKVHTGIYVLLPNDKPKVVDDESGKLHIQFNFNNFSETVTFPLEEITIWKEDVEDNQYIGGGKCSNAANIDLLSSLEAYHQNKQTITEAGKLGCSFDGIIKVAALTANNEKAQAIRQQFIDDLRSNKGGIGVLDAGAEYEAIQRNLKLIDPETQKEIKENILLHEGITIEMLQGKFTPQEKEAFYENHIEPAAISLGQALTKTYFSQWQTSFGDEIILYPHKVQLMATSEIVQIIKSTISAGVFMIDEYREMLGYAPLPNGEGQARPRGFNNLDGGNIGGGDNG